jgi:hypothetical protein
VDDETARRFIGVYDLVGKSHKLLNLEIPVSGLYMLAAPSTPDEAREAVIARAEAGEKLSVADVRATVDRTEASGRKARGRKPPKQADGHPLTDAELSAEARKAAAALAERQLDFVEKHADFSEPSAAARKAAYAAEELNNGALPPEDTPDGDVAKTAFTALCLLVLAASRDPHLADHLVAIAAAQAPDPFPSIERLIEVLIEVDGRLRGPEGNHAEPPAGDDPGPMPEFLRRRRAS